MTPEERDRWWGEAKRRRKFVGEDVLQYDDIFDIVRAAVEEEREACARLVENTKRSEWGHAHHIRARGKDKFCGCGRPSKDPVTGGCGEC